MILQEQWIVSQERFVAKVSTTFFNSIQKILANLSDPENQRFFPGDVALHMDNIAGEFQLTAPMISAKCRYAKGNVQFTMAKATNKDGDCVLLDCDMDEHSNIIEHAGDLFKHVFTGGTHPIDIHEYIVHHQNNVDLGYALRPVNGAALAPASRPQAQSWTKENSKPDAALNNVQGDINDYTKRTRRNRSYVRKSR